MRHVIGTLALAVLGAGCGSGSTGAGESAQSALRPPSPPEPAAGTAYSGPTRLRFNQLALRLGLPLFWQEDTDGDGAVDPDEVRALLFHDSSVTWVEEGRFTPAFDEAWRRMRALDGEAPPDDERRALVRRELDHAAPTLVYTDLSSLPPAHRAFASQMMRAGASIDALYAKQVGMTALAGALGGDPESRSLFRRNWGPRCRGATTESEAACSALAGAPRQPVDVYPPEMQASDEFCETLEARRDGERLLSPFTVLREREGSLVAVPYTEEYRAEMEAIAGELETAAGAMTDREEQPLVAYLRAAATAFRTNEWEPADEAWSRMSARNSAWYVRVGPDETYWDPCSRKAGFHLTFARIDRASLAWQDRLTPLQQDMEQALATLVPRRYRARTVRFQMPDFIEIVINAGDDRDPFGATIGQSLPNWGAVAEQGRGRTVAMSNLYTDPDSRALRRAQAAALLSQETMQIYTTSPEPGLLATILHEAAHNLGPTNEYRYRGRTADAAFGGGLASMLEELKAQTGSLFYVDMLRERGVVDERDAREAYLDSIVWAFGHVSRGMYTPTGQRKAYSQLAAIQLGFLMDEGALRFDAAATSASGAEGAFTLDFERMPEASRKLMERVMQIKATNDRSAAEELATLYVDGDTVPQVLIVERYRAFPQAAFVYAVDP